MEKTKMENKMINHHLAPIARGYTDIAAFTLAVCHGKGEISYVKIDFSEDGLNKVYICDNSEKNYLIPDYYSPRGDVFFEKVFWFWIFSDVNRIYSSRHLGGKVNLGLFEKGRSAIIALEPIEEEGTLFVEFERDGEILGDLVEYGGENACKEETILQLRETSSVKAIYETATNCGGYALIWKNED